TDSNIVAPLFPCIPRLLRYSCDRFDLVRSLLPETAMPQLSTWNLDPTRLLTRRELAAVLADLTPRAQRSANTQRNLVMVRLACSCGLRVSESAALQLDDAVIRVARPHLRLRCGTGGRSRLVPLWWDLGTLADLVTWKRRRVKDGARGHDPFVGSVQANRVGLPLQRHAIRRRFLSACKVLGLARLRTSTIHHGRHTYISH